MLDEERPEKPVTLEFINKEIQRTLQRQHDTKMIGNNQQAAVQTQAIHTKQQKTKYVSNHHKDDSKTPSTPCWFCGAMHYSNTCQYKNHKCKQCGRVGHKEGYCNVKSDGNNNKQKHSADNRHTQQTANKQNTNSNKNTAQTRAIDNSIDNWFHRKHVNVLINNQNVELQLDTASDISIISEEIWASINSPTLTSTKRTARDANHNKIEFIGEFEVPGIRSAPGAFQQAIEQILAGIPEATAYLDDVIIASETFQQHLQSIRHVLNRFSEYNMTGHQGQQRMKSIARSNIYWPNIDQHIEDFVRLCPQCQTNMRSPTKTSLCSWPISTKPLQRVHIDIAGPIRSHYYLVIVDSFSYHPQSNGQAERFVDIIKTAIRKLYDGDSKDNTHLQEFLLQYRSTPNTNCAEGKTPAELFIGRKLRTEIDLIKPQDSSEIIRDTKMEEQYNRKHGANHREFQINQQVFVKTYKDNRMIWRPGVIIEKVGHVNYHVEIKDADSDKVIKSHTNQIRERFVDVNPHESTAYNLQPLFNRPAEDDHPHLELPDGIQSDNQDVNELFNTSSNNDDATNESTTSPPRRSTRNKRTPAWHRDYEVHH
ncbi:uncharacterized protein LOC135950539 [Calliphora vicina]|uniref:uncharacterized protein LOC135950539 n=1 Tax=Calliphora vicina TaxID=7373 RepID=UPI00325AD862